MFHVYRLNITVQTNENNLAFCITMFVKFYGFCSPEFDKWN